MAAIPTERGDEVSGEGAIEPSYPTLHQAWNQNTKAPSVGG